MHYDLVCKKEMKDFARDTLERILKYDPEVLIITAMAKDKNKITGRGHGVWVVDTRSCSNSELLGLLEISKQSIYEERCTPASLQEKDFA